MGRITPPNSGTYVATAERGWTLPTNGVAQTFDRNVAASDLTGGLSTGRLNMVGIYLRAGQAVSNITFVAGSTALSSGSNQWFSLWSSARAKLGVTADDTNTAWAANTAKTLAMASPYVVPASGLYYLGITVVATTVPTLRGVLGGNAVIFGIAPILAGTSDTGLTNPASAPATAAALTASTAMPYAYVT